MSIKDHPGYFRKFVAKDELFDSIDVLNCKLSQCAEAGLSYDDIQVVLDDYHKCHVNYPLIRVLK